jgi:hypothetical protein
MRFRTVLLIAAGLASVAAGAGAQTPAGVEVRPARAADLPGMWQMAALIMPPEADASDPLFAPYQVFFFDQSGKMKHMTSARPFTSFALFEAAPLVTRYSVEKKGTLVLTNPAWDAPRRYQCTVVTKSAGGEDRKSARPGDVLLTGLDEAGKPAWTKVLRKGEGR